MQGKCDSTVPETKPRVNSPHSKLCLLFYLPYVRNSFFEVSRDEEKCSICHRGLALLDKCHMVTQSPHPSPQQDGGKNQESKSTDIFATSQCIKPKQIRCLQRLWHPFQESKSNGQFRKHYFGQMLLSKWNYSILAAKDNYQVLCFIHVIY